MLIQTLISDDLNFEIYRALDSVRPQVGGCGVKVGVVVAVETELGVDMPSPAIVEMDAMNKGVLYVGGLLSSLGWMSTLTEIELDMGVEVPRRAMASRSKTVVIAAVNPHFQPLPTQTPLIF